MKSEYMHQISQVYPGSIAEELELAPGDKLLSINGQPIEDVLDYRFYIQNESVTLVVEKPDKSQVEWEIEKDAFEDLGIEFENGLMSDYRHCSNGCIFCFIDQMPPGMRETLYFKDDDARLSFLQGNYITMTNMKKKDLERIVRYRLSPINISVHTTNPELRKKMLKNRFAGDIMEKLRFLRDGDIEMNSQIVLCRGINDGEELKRTLRDLASLCPQMQSLSVVPVGLTKYREGLYPLEPLTKEDALAAIEAVEELQREMMDLHGIHFAHASDELYLLAGLPVPEAERYDGYVQLENGVGMIRLQLEEAGEALAELSGDDRRHTISLATGRLAYPCLCRIAESVRQKFPGVELKIYPIRNDFFGELVTVSGLVTGTDLKAQLSGKELGECLLLPGNMFRSGEEVFLDDMTRKELEEALGVPVRIVRSSGEMLVRAMIGETEEESAEAFHNPYEL